MTDVKYLTEGRAGECLVVVQRFIDGYAGPGWKAKL